MAYGVMRECIYYYRKRTNGTSAIDITTSSMSWYFDTPILCYKRLFDYSKKMFGAIPMYIQYLIMYDLSVETKSKIHESLSKNDKITYGGIILVIKKYRR